MFTYHDERYSDPLDPEKLSADDTSKGVAFRCLVDTGVVQGMFAEYEGVQIFQRYRRGKTYRAQNVPGQDVGSRRVGLN
ncbi:hypothetical protein ACFTZB_25535 [Rhodococcus sp. NPDC057014]|uniref:hypothetical protein n=1 Tax=Rhodococcus sp. NPDC057014 TaxID=3346000 RepID=UPI00362E9E16